MEIRYIKMVVEGVHSGDVLEIPTIRKMEYLATLIKSEK
jgi:hypothetical protein